MSEEQKVTVEMSVYQAAEVLELLFNEQKNYSYEFAPKRIEEIRKIISSIDKSIENVLLNS